MLIPILLAGGEGKRLWPLSNQRTPKQFLTFGEDNKSFYQQSFERVCRPDVQHIITITSAAFSHHALWNLCQNDNLTHHLLFEPLPRNTAVAITLAALFAQKQWGNPVLWVNPCDHVITKPERLHEIITQAIPLAKSGKIITLGIRPTEPSTQYGYIIPDTEESRNPWLNVTQFIEKPTLEILLPLYPHTYWNSGMFLFSVDTLLSQIKYHAPALYDAACSCFSQTQPSLPGMTFPKEYYEKFPALPIDKVLMEQSDRLIVFPADIGWSDIGSWQALWEYTRHGNNDNQNTCNSCVDFLNKHYMFSPHS